MNIAGLINFDGRNLCVYRDLNDPLFKLKDIAYFVKYSGDLKYLEMMCERDEITHIYVDDFEGDICFITEHGLYDILSQLRDETSRKWRRVIFNKLIAMRKEQHHTIVEQFDEWNHELDDIYWDDEKKMMMVSETLPGGDVIQKPYLR